ncbi:uncharacterized protein LOC17896984 isoform X2 [Capsella rubella]|uniref:uncharacterized protein LOC17896984 isoform X2 n=1 Tax=Capsella rubella TaxID=81985 RepID=UPI000CD5B435|nr:uncharacterized protein LOC17896984 isoform X2 [Capsella rubella]
MSRYFTTPPPVYARNWGNGQNLVESTKIERQIVSEKVHRKEKKEKKKDKKPKKEKKSPKLEYISAKQVSDDSKQVSDESEQLEKSCLTEEHVGYLSDGSQNSKKRRRETSPAVVESQIKATPVAGKPLRIRFVFKKPKEVEVVHQEDRLCSTSGAERPSEIPSSVSLPKTCDHDVNLLSTSLQSNKITMLAAAMNGFLVQGGKITLPRPKLLLKIVKT